MRTFDFFAKTGRSWHRAYYTERVFTQVKMTSIQFNTLLGKGRFFIWDRLVEPLVNSFPIAQGVYEMTFLSRLFPAADVVAVLQK